MHRFFYPGLFSYVPGFGVIGSLLFGIGVFSLAKRYMVARPNSLETPQKKLDPLEILTERFAQGELSVEEFEERARTLEAHRGR